MLQAYAAQIALDKLGFENKTIDISGFNSSSFNGVVYAGVFDNVVMRTAARPDSF